MAPISDEIHIKNTLRQAQDHDAWFGIKISQKDLKLRKLGVQGGKY